MTYQITSLKVAQQFEDRLEVTQRIARLIAKGKDGAKAIEGRAVSESMAVIVPRVSLGDIQAILSGEVGKEWIKAQVEKLQDGILRKLFAAGKNAVFDEQFRNSALIDAMRVEESSGRFSKDSIATWFDSDLFDLLHDAIKAKFPAVSDDKLQKIIDGYRADFQLLAAREVMVSAEIKIKLEKALALLPDDYVSTVTSERIAEKLAAAGTKIVEDVL